MPPGDFVEPGTVQKPLLIGRVARLAFAAFTLFTFSLLLVSARVLVGTDGGDANVLYFTDEVVADAWVWFIWIWFVSSLAWAWWYFSDLVDIGFGKAWGRWPQIVFFPSVVVLLVIDLVVYGSAWEPLLGWGVFLFTEFFYGFIGLSFLLSAIFVSPG